MARLTRMQKFAELRDKMSNDAETSISTNELNEYENKLKNIEGYSAPVKDINDDVHEYIFGKPEEVTEEPAVTVQNEARTGDDYFNNTDAMPDAFKAFKETFAQETPKYEPKAEEHHLFTNNENKDDDGAHVYIFSKPEDISDQVTDTVKAVLNNEEPAIEKPSIEELGKYEEKANTPIIDSITIVTNPGLDENEEYAEEPVKAESASTSKPEEPLYTYKPIESFVTTETKKEEPLYTYKPIETNKEEEPLYVYKPTETFEPTPAAPKANDEGPLYTYKPSDSFNYGEPVNEKVELEIKEEIKKEEEPLYVYKPSFPEEEKAEPAPINVNPMEVGDGKSFLDEALEEVKIYSHKEGLQTVEEISPAIIDEIRGHKETKEETFKPLDTEEVKVQKEKEEDEEFSNTVSLEINKILAELNKKQEESETNIISEVEFKQPAELPELDASNYARETTKAETSFVANYLKDTSEVPITDEVKTAYKEKAPEVITNPGLKAEDDKPIEIKNYSEIEDEIKKELTVEKTIDKTIPFVVSDNDDEEDEEDSAPNKLLNVILIVLIVALIAVLGVIVYYILLAKGIIS